MQIEVRADGLHINGYVNVPGRESRPMRHRILGAFVEVIEQRAFQRAIDRASRIDMLIDHDKQRRIASTEDGTLKVYEDEVGLRAESIVTDEQVIAAANEGKIKGWSFNMFNTRSDIEQRSGTFPLRHVRELDMSEITLVLDKIPAYRSTSVEVRSGDEIEIEERAGLDTEVNDEKIEYEEVKDEQEERSEEKEEKEPEPDYSVYEATVKLMKTL